MVLLVGFLAVDRSSVFMDALVVCRPVLKHGRWLAWGAGLLFFRTFSVLASLGLS